jgi:Dopa 4,5-dioxygenase family
MFHSDIHVYYFQKNASQMKFARELWERIRRECLSPNILSHTPFCNTPSYDY